MDVSVIIPIYNEAPYIKECLESVMGQTFGGNMECILVDDCCIDHSMDIAEGMVAEYKGDIEFRIVRHEQNKGLSAARNTGLDKAKGEYVYFLDSDDAISNNCIEQLYSAAKEYPECMMVQGRSDTIPANAPNPFEKTFRQKCAMTNDEVRRCFFERRTMSESAWNNLVRRDFLINNSLYFEEGRLGEDQLWMFFLLKHLNYVCFINKITYHYRRRGDSIANNMEHEPRFRFIKSLGDNYHDFLTNLTPYKEKQELNFYSFPFSYHYVCYAKEILIYEDVFILYYTMAKQYKCHYVKMKLKIAHFLSKFDKGRLILMMLKFIRHPITMIKKVWRALCFKIKR